MWLLTHFQVFTSAPNPKGLALLVLNSRTESPPLHLPQTGSVVGAGSIRATHSGCLSLSHSALPQGMEGDGPGASLQPQLPVLLHSDETTTKHNYCENKLCLSNIWGDALHSDLQQKIVFL